MILATTGHRPDKLGGYRKSREPTEAELRLKRAYAAQLLALGPERVLTGMAQGADQWIAEVCFNLKVPYWAYVPFEGQDKPWPMFARTLYTDLLYKAAKVIVVSKGGYTAGKMHARNRRLVNDGDALLATWDGSSGGTASTVQYAHVKQKPVYTIDPRPFLA